MADPATQFHQASLGQGIYFTPTVFHPNQVLPLSFVGGPWSGVGKAFQEAGQAIQQSGLNPAVREQMRAEVAQAKTKESVAQEAQDLVASARAQGGGQRPSESLTGDTLSIKQGYDTGTNRTISPPPAPTNRSTTDDTGKPPAAKTEKGFVEQEKTQPPQQQQQPPKDQVPPNNKPNANLGDGQKSDDGVLGFINGVDGLGDGKDKNGNSTTQWDTVVRDKNGNPIFVTNKNGGKRTVTPEEQQEIRESKNFAASKTGDDQHIVMARHYDGGTPQAQNAAYTQNAGTTDSGTTDNSAAPGPEKFSTLAQAHDAYLKSKGINNPNNQYQIPSQFQSPSVQPPAAPTGAPGEQQPQAGGNDIAANQTPVNQTQPNAAGAAAVSHPVISAQTALAAAKHFSTGASSADYQFNPQTGEPGFFIKDKKGNGSWVAAKTLAASTGGMVGSGENLNQVMHIAANQNQQNAQQQAAAQAVQAATDGTTTGVTGHESNDTGIVAQVPGHNLPPADTTAVNPPADTTGAVKPPLVNAPEAPGGVPVSNVKTTQEGDKKVIDSSVNPKDMRVDAKPPTTENTTKLTPDDRSKLALDANGFRYRTDAQGRKEIVLEDGRTVYDEGEHDFKTYVTDPGSTEPHFIGFQSDDQKNREELVKEGGYQRDWVNTLNQQQIHDLLLQKHLRLNRSQPSDGVMSEMYGYSRFEKDWQAVTDDLHNLRNNSGAVGYSNATQYARAIAELDAQHKNDISSAFPRFCDYMGIPKTKENEAIYNDAIALDQTRRNALTSATMLAESLHIQPRDLFRQMGFQEIPLDLDARVSLTGGFNAKGSVDSSGNVQGGARTSLVLPYWNMAQAPENAVKIFNYWKSVYQQKYNDMKAPNRDINTPESWDSDIKQLNKYGRIFTADHLSRPVKWDSKPDTSWEGAEKAKQLLEKTGGSDAGITPSPGNIDVRYPSADQAVMQNIERGMHTDLAPSFKLGLGQIPGLNLIPGSENWPSIENKAGQPIVNPKLGALPKERYLPDPNAQEKERMAKIPLTPGPGELTTLSRPNPGQTTSAQPVQHYDKQYDVPKNTGTGDSPYDVSKFSQPEIRQIIKQAKPGTYLMLKGKLAVITPEGVARPVDQGEQIQRNQQSRVVNAP